MYGNDYSNTSLSHGYAVSTGGHVVGYTKSIQAPLGNAFIYYQGEMTILCVNPCSNDSIATGISADSRVAAGRYIQNQPPCQGNGEAPIIPTFAAKWINGQKQILGAVAGCNSAGEDVSDDGNVVVGWTETWSLSQVACYWLGSTPVPIGTLHGGAYSYALGVSANGEVIAGVSSTSSGGIRAFVWTAAQGMSELPILPEGISSVANAVSPDATVIVGAIQRMLPFGDKVAVRWISPSNWTPQPLNPSGSLSRLIEYSEAKDVSAGGAVIVGTMSRRLSENSTEAKRCAFRWTAESGIQDLNDLYSSLLTPGSYLAVAEAISPDGRFITGAGVHCRAPNLCRWEAFLLDTALTNNCVPNGGDTDGNGCVDDADLVSVVFSIGRSGPSLPADCNCDGTVDDGDLVEVLFRFGTGC